jgi:hypothetical protein
MGLILHMNERAYAKGDDGHESTLLYMKWFGMISVAHRH